MSDARARDRPRRNAIALLLVPSAVIAAGALVLIRLHFQPPNVPRYRATILGDVQATASDGGPSEDRALRRDSLFEIELRPESAVTGAVGARAFLLRGDEVHGWDPPFSVSLDGVVRITGTVDKLFEGIPRGRWEVVIAVGRPEVLPTAPRDVLYRRGDDPILAGWHLVRAPVRLEE
jgi:hypothetical protein